MAICDNCGKKIDLEYEDDEFETETGMSLKYGNHFTGTLCCECALSRLDTGDYYENCEKCYKRFHVSDDDERFDDDCRHFWLNIDIPRSDISELILCADCAFDIIKEQYGEKSF